MRFKLGAAIGFTAGYLVATRASEERRRQVDDAIHAFATIRGCGT